MRGSPSGSGSVLVVGGGSRLAMALRPRLPADSVYVSRRPTGRGEERIVADYAAVPPALFAETACVINCVGTSGGAAEQMHRLNVEVPAVLAGAARAAGVRHFIHVSSFSVYGAAETIDRSTPERPDTAYGRSKAEGDSRLLALAGDGFGVTLLRLPMLYDEGSLGKLGRLLRLWRRVGIVPVPESDVRRAMIGMELAAEVIARLVHAPRHGVVLAADPQHFSYRGVQGARPERLLRLVIPQPAADLARRGFPALARRLFGNSCVPAESNLAVELGLSSRLYADIAAARL